MGRLQLQTLTSLSGFLLGWSAIETVRETVSSHSSVVTEMCLSLSLSIRIWRSHPHAGSLWEIQWLVCPSPADSSSCPSFLPPLSLVTRSLFFQDPWEIVILNIKNLAKDENYQISSAIVTIHSFRINCNYIILYYTRYYWPFNF